MHDTIGSRLKIWRDSIGLEQDQAAAHLDMSASTYQNYERDVRRPRADAMEKFARGGINANWLLTGVPPMLIKDLSRAAKDNSSPYQVAEPKGAYLLSTVPAVELSEEQYATWASAVAADGFAPVRYYSQVAISAGHGALNDDHAPDALLFSRKFLCHIGAHPRQLLLVRVRGDSMHPTLHNGWTVMIDTATRRVDSGIYVIQSGGQEMVKRLESRPGGVVRVISDNRALYEEYEIAADCDDFAVLGRVVWFAGLVQ